MGTTSGEEELVAISLLLTSSYYLLLSSDDEDNDNNQPPRVPRSVWVRDWLKKRETDGAYAKLLQEFRNGGESGEKLFRDFTRLSPTDFDYLLQLVTPQIEKQDTQFRRAIPAGERLALALHYLATGENYHALRFVFRIPQSTISLIIPLVLDAIWSVLRNEYVRVSFLHITCVHYVFLRYLHCFFYLRLQQRKPNGRRSQNDLMNNGITHIVWEQWTVDTS